MLYNYLKWLILLFTLSLFSCQKIEISKDIFFDYKQFSKLTISADKKIINNFYESKVNGNYIDYYLNQSPKDYLNIWFQDNINIIGNENIFEINLLDASLKKSEVLNNEASKYGEKTIYLFELSFLVEYKLYNEEGLLLASVIAETKRTTSSGKFISINESNNIIDLLIFDSLNDFSKKTEELVSMHMNNYIL